MKDNNEDMKKLINAWESSKKFKSLQIELDKLKKQYADFTTLSNEDINKYLERIEISKEKLQGIIDDEKNIEFENDDFNFLEKLQAYKKLNKEQFFTKYQRSLVIFYISLLGYQRVENYEMCALIKKVIEIQIKLQTRIMKELFVCEKEDFDYLSLVQEKIIQTILLDKQ